MSRLKEYVIFVYYADLQPKEYIIEAYTESEAREYIKEIFSNEFPDKEHEIKEIDIFSEINT